MLTSPGGAIVCSLCVSEGYILHFQHLGVHLTVYGQAAGWLVTSGQYILINLFTNILQMCRIFDEKKNCFIKKIMYKMFNHAISL